MEKTFPERFLQKGERCDATGSGTIRGSVLKKPSYVQPDQTGEPVEDVDIQTADAVVGQISVGNRKDRRQENQNRSRRAGPEEPPKHVLVLLRHWFVPTSRQALTAPPPTVFLMQYSPSRLAGVQDHTDAHVQSRIASKRCYHRRENIVPGRVAGSRDQTPSGGRLITHGIAEEAAGGGDEPEHENHHHSDGNNWCHHHVNEAVSKASLLQEGVL